MKLEFVAVVALLGVFQVIPTHGQVNNFGLSVGDVMVMSKQFKDWKSAAEGCVPLVLLVVEKTNYIISNGIFGYDRKLLTKILEETSGVLDASSTPGKESCVAGHRKILNFIFKGFGTDTACLSSEIGKVVDKGMKLLSKLIMAVLGQVNVLVQLSDKPEAFTDAVMNILNSVWAESLELGVSVLRIIPNVEKCREDPTPVKEITTIIAESARNC